MPQATQSHVSPDDIRLQFSQAMSDMYKLEVPLYGNLLELVNATNAQVLARRPELVEQLSDAEDLSRLSVERHGAIRLGAAAEMRMMRRMLAVMGMFPVGYYDLSVAGVPVHATAFRPISDRALAACPFRLFTSLLRHELIDDEQARTLASALLAKREIFTDRVKVLIGKFEDQGGLCSGDADEFIEQALHTFRWHTQSTATYDQYNLLNKQHRLVADIAAFKGPHINHLTPRTLDIDQVQRSMTAYGIEPKAFIEGPPKRRCAILLRQTSFKALEEAIAFADQNNMHGRHTARFGEIEQRGIALTRKGRELYDLLLTQARGSHAAAGGGSDSYVECLERAFREFPDDYAALRSQRLAHFRYRVLEEAQPLPGEFNTGWTADSLVAKGYVAFDPLVYEDFLPVSAAGIFQSNLGDVVHSDYRAPANQRAFEDALGATVHDECSLYADVEARSLEHCIERLSAMAR
ncbi:DUF1338 family protein [Pseudomonas sp. CCM 7891]|uniref:2-oxoadipate dioxygenase/decarboxylase n=1 Tax=Pseudomonas karstica TaxID=1055468 RepID=A0A7X2RQT5_9PSED|nr:VOC family protein [Pseudomonas karstica]MTD19308.1 DUF1338 family protein [Pseudomonas karstica]